MPGETVGREGCWDLRELWPKWLWTKFQIGSFPGGVDALPFCGRRRSTPWSALNTVFRGKRRSTPVLRGGAADWRQVSGRWPPNRRGPCDSACRPRTAHVGTSEVLPDTPLTVPGQARLRHREDAGQASKTPRRRRDVTETTNRKTMPKHKRKKTRRTTWTSQANNHSFSAPSAQ